MLGKLKFEINYSKSRQDIYECFYKPAMENSVKYDRVTGYFGSSIFLVINESLQKFIENNGKIRIITSPELSPEDAKTIINAYDEKAKKKLESKLNDIIMELNECFPNSTALLSNLIIEGILEIKLAVFGEEKSQNRLFHDKAGVFTDKEGVSIAFRGSFNETFSGLSSEGNSESVDVYIESGEREIERINSIKDQFESLWNNNEPKTRVFTIPETTLEKIKSIRKKTDKNYLIEKTLVELFIEKKKAQVQNSKWYAEKIEGARKVRKHQEHALDNWEKNDFRGLLKMATGSGKTFIGLCAIRKMLFEYNKIPIILVPTKDIFKQWADELEKMFDGERVRALKLGANNTGSLKELKTFTSQSNLEYKRYVISTYQKFNSEETLKNIEWGEHIFLLCDEVHNIGSAKNRKIMQQVVGPRLGLSATPERFGDEIGTDLIFDFFNGIIKPEYGLVDAIKDEVLTPYYYYVETIKLDEEEQKNWDAYTNRINKLLAIKFSKKQKEEDANDSQIEFLNFQRANIIKRAKNKISKIVEILKNKFNKGDRWLVYLNDKNQVLELKNELEKIPKFSGQVFEYHSSTEGHLDTTLKNFEIYGAILLSINCLDEGVDIPAAEYAIIAASSKNPRQYIQRRGRVLRKSKNKNFAYIYDCFVLPAEKSIEEKSPSLSIIRNEIIRSRDFATNAINKTEPEYFLDSIIRKYNIDIKVIGGYEEDEEE